MTVQELLGELRARDIVLSVDGDRLKCSAPKGRLTAELQREIAGRKPEIIGFLREASCAVPASIPRADRAQPLPLSVFQERLWFEHRLQPENPAYNITAFIRFPGPVSVSALEESLRAVALRHECLRTNFVEYQDGPAQVIHQEPSVALPVTDLSGLSELGQTEGLQGLIREQMRQPFDLSAGPLFRTRLVRLAPEQHVLVLTIHHIVADGWSLGVFFRETGEIYRAITSGETPAIPDLPLQYADYACWQRQELASGTQETDLSYWKQKLEASPSLLELPTDHRRPPVRSHEGAVLHFTLPAPVSTALKDLATRSGASLFMVLLAAFKALLHRYTNQPDVLVGTPVNCRNRPELENLIGCFVNTLVLRTEFAGDLTGLELLHRVRETVLEAHAHMSLPFEKLVETLRPERTLSHSPLFQVSFNLQNTPLSSTYQTISASAMFDLALFMWEAQDTLCGAFEYSTELFEAGTIERMAGHFKALTAALAEQPDRPLAALPMLSEAERQQILVAWNATQAPYAQDKCWHELFEEQAARNPQAIAVVHEDERLSYQELNERANRLAHHLRALGVKPDARVAVCTERGLDTVVAMLAALKAGGAFVPLDPAYPQERLAAMLDDSAPAAVLVHRATRDALPATRQRPVIDLDADRAQWATQSRANPDPAAWQLHSGHLAYVIYTSGSTGQPKGVMVEHRSVINLAGSLVSRVYRDVRSFTGMRVGLNASFGFDASVKQWMMLAYGASLYVIPDRIRLDAGLFVSSINKWQLDALDCTPAQLSLLLSARESMRLPGHVLVGGEAIDQHLWDLLQQRTENVIYNVYGPTETTVDAVICDIHASGGRPVIGRPIGNTQVYILDDARQPVPVGVAGELYIGGAGVARGYLNRAELTAERFVKDPYAGKPGARMYKTGDLVRYLADGNIEYLGRNDFQVKIRGFRIELGEIEARLAGCDGVREAVVVAREDHPGDKRLVAYVVPYEGVDLSPAYLRGELSRGLAEYMVPSTYVMLQALPRTPNGKLDRKALPLPARKAKEEVTPRSLLETQLLSIWEQVLNVQGIGVHDNFFSLGGHSLLAVNLFTRMEKVFGTLPVTLLFQAPTVEEMAARLIDGGVASPWRSLVAMQTRGDRPPLFLVPGVSGNVLTCSKLAMALGPEQPVYGLHSLGFDGKQAPLERVEDIAAHFVSEIRAVQEDGPYRLAGHCVGGAVAFEIASRLAADGHEVAPVLLIDTWPPGSVPGGLGSIPLMRPALFFASRLGTTLRNLWQLDPAERIAFVRRKLGIVTRMAARRGTHEPYRAGLLARVVEQANRRAIGRYQPKPYGGQIALIVSNDPAASHARDPRLKWAALAGGRCEVHRVPVPEHRNLVEEPWVQSLAGLIKKSLEEKGAPAGTYEASPLSV